MDFNAIPKGLKQVIALASQGHNNTIDPGEARSILLEAGRSQVSTSQLLTWVEELAGTDARDVVSTQIEDYKRRYGGDVLSRVQALQIPGSGRQVGLNVSRDSRPITKRFADMNEGRTFNDNLTIALNRALGNPANKQRTLTSELAATLFYVTKRDGFSELEVAQARAIVATFTQQGNPNAPMLGELAAKIGKAASEQTDAAQLAANKAHKSVHNAFSDLASEATLRERTMEWFKGRHLPLSQAEAAISKTNVGSTIDLEHGTNVRCPIIGGLIAEGSLEVEANGDINLEQLDELMINRLGITPTRATITHGTGLIGNHVADAWDVVVHDKFNINHLTGSFLDHQRRGNTGILSDGKFDAQAFEKLIANSSDGATLSVSDFVDAMRKQVARDSDNLATFGKGIAEDIFEMAALINTFGFVDSEGKRRIGVDTLRDIYEHKKLPSPEELMEGREPTGFPGHVGTMGKMAGGWISEATEDAVDAARAGLDRIGTWAERSVDQVIEDWGNKWRN